MNNKAVRSSFEIPNSRLFLLITTLPFFLSCSFGPGNFQSRHSTDLDSRIIRRIAVLSPERVGVGEQTKPSAPTTAPAGDKGGKKEPADILSDLIYRTVSTLPNWQLVSDREVAEVLSMVPQGATGSRARKLGELVFADAVLYGRLIRFHERVGEDWGVQSPASVAFVIELWDVRRGDLIWSGQFDETQKTLLQNLFGIGEFTQRGAKWLTAEELALEGVKKALNQLHQALYGSAG